MVAARDGDELVKVMLADRFQVAIDEAAMRLGSVDSGSYLEGWRTGDWIDEVGSPGELAAKISQSLENEFDQETLNSILDSIGTEDNQ